MSKFCCRLCPECPMSAYLKIVSIAALLFLALLSDMAEACV